MAPWTTLHSVDTRRNEQLSHVSFTCFNIVIWLAAHFFVRPNVNTQTALTLPGPIPLQKGVGPGNEATLSQDTDMLSQDTLSQDTIK